MDNNLEALKTNYLRAIVDSRTWERSEISDKNFYKITAYVVALEEELEKVLGSPTLKLAAEVARARQAEINRLQDLLSMCRESNDQKLRGWGD
jgi:hypothetical protein